MLSRSGMLSKNTLKALAFATTTTKKKAEALATNHKLDWFHWNKSWNCCGNEFSWMLSIRNTR